MKKALSILMGGVFALTAVASLAGCGENGVEGDEVIIYVEYNGLSGKDDDLVKAELERKFEEDTGKAIKLSVEPHTTSTLGQKVTGAIGASEQLDGIVTHYSSDSFLTTMITGEKELKDLTELVTEENMPNYLARFTETTDPGWLAYNKGVYNGKIYALSSIEHNSVFGMLVNKSHMALTDFDPDEYDIANEGYKSLTISEFTTMLEQMKANVGDGLNRPLGGAPYDIEYFLDPVFETTGYTHLELIGDQLYPAWATENYCKLLEYERQLQEKKLWTESPLSSGTVERDFMAGKSSVYAPFPEVTQMIEAAKKLKLSTGDDCVMLAPLRADGEETSRGNARHVSAFLGLVAPIGGKTTELMLQFVDWLSIKENYEIAKYGIEGTHWEKATTASGAEAYAYPADKRADYEQTPPYSGIYCLLTDVNISNRVYAGYTETQAKWVEEVHGFPTYPANGYDDEGVNMPSIPASNRKLKQNYTRMSDEYVGVRAMAWSDAPLNDKSITSRHSELIAKLEDANSYKPYIEFLTTEYNKIMEGFLTK